eukprot:m.181643 g.181643  ORF g.181643 m.181643 type:complete len:63 (+) comp16873_c0_seq4:606-794(+)
MTQALVNQGEKEMAVAVLQATLTDFAATGIEEDVTPSTRAHGVGQYVASATNVVLALRLVGY